MGENDGHTRNERSELTVRCLFFARYAELVGTTEIQLELCLGSTVADAVVSLRKDVRGCEMMPERPLVALNQVHADYGSMLEDGDELAFLPPLAGG